MHSCVRGTSYNPPVKPILFVHDYEGLRIPPIFDNTPPVDFCTFPRRILLPKNEPSLDRYDYSASPAVTARIAHHPLSKFGARQEAQDCPSRGLKPLRC